MDGGHRDAEHLAGVGLEVAGDVVRTRRVGVFVSSARRGSGFNGLLDMSAWMGVRGVRLQG